jgi:hypothetical protein
MRAALLARDTATTTCWCKEAATTGDLTFKAAVISFPYLLEFFAPWPEDSNHDCVFFVILTPLSSLM